MIICPKLYELNYLNKDSGLFIETRIVKPETHSEKGKVKN